MIPLNAGYHRALRTPNTKLLKQSKGIDAWPEIKAKALIATKTLPMMSVIPTR
jgi:hypothetical protein